jgi:hypothetical protein
MFFVFLVIATDGHFVQVVMAIRTKDQLAVTHLGFSGLTFWLFDSTYKCAFGWS